MIIALEKEGIRKAERRHKGNNARRTGSTADMDNPRSPRLALFRHHHIVTRSTTVFRRTSTMTAPLIHRLLGELCYRILVIAL